jgi:hypothetical protein
LEWDWLLHPFDKFKEAKAFQEMTKTLKGKKWNEYPQEYKSMVGNKLWVLYTPIWLFIGLFTFQWVGYLLILVLNFFIIAPLSKFTKNSIAYIMINWLNSLIVLVFALFVIVNHYHLNIDLTQWLFSLFK